MLPFTSPDTWTNEYLDKMSMLADPLADDVIQKMVDEFGSGKAKEIFDLLIHNIDFSSPEFPSYVEDYLRQSSVLPDWYDPSLSAKAVALFEEHGPMMLSVLYFKSLPTVYAIKRNAEVLHTTGRLEPGAEFPARFARRIAETAQFIVHVTEPHAFLPNGMGLLYLQRVRLIHASIRFFTKANGWNIQEKGEPTNQEELAMTLLTFNLSIIDGLRILGAKVSLEEEEAWFHHWNVAGHLLGIQHSLMAKHCETGNILLNKFLERGKAATPEGAELTRALILFSEQALPGKAFDRYPQVLMHLLIGDELSQLLGVNTNPGCLGQLLPGFIKKYMGFREKLEDYGDGVDKLLNKANGLLVMFLVNYFNKEKGSKFVLPERLKRKWRMKFGR